MAANEAVARSQQLHFSYTSEERSARTFGHLWREQVVETGDGTLRRLLAIDGRPLTPAEVTAENGHIADIVAHPEEFRRLNEAHKDDEVHATRLLQILPTAFLLTQAGEQDGCVRFVFKPNPAFQPSTYEERVAHAMEGVVTIREPEGRLCLLEAHLMQPVEFGFGMLGRVEQGGHFALQRAPVDAKEWKTIHVAVHIQGRILLLKTLARDQESQRTNVHLVPQNLSLADAEKMLAQ